MGLILRGFGDQALDPISFDNSTMPTVAASDATSLNGLYQFDPLFYHKSFDRLIPWEDRGKCTIWECTMFCSPLNKTGVGLKLALVHLEQSPKKNLWYLLEMHDEDANSPIIFARSKFRKVETYRSPWVTVTPGGKQTPKDLPAVHLISAWDAFRFDTPLKWGVTVVVILAAVLWWRSRDKDD